MGSVCSSSGNQTKEEAQQKAKANSIQAQMRKSKDVTGREMYETKGSRELVPVNFEHLEQIKQS